jgi:hypothetical protein
MTLFGRFEIWMCENILRIIVFSALVFGGMSVMAQQANVGDEDEAPSFLIVIFSPAVDNGSRTTAEGVVWKSFVDRLKKRTSKLSVVNEVAINESADRARAYELARQFDKFTIWLQFSYINNTNADIQFHTRSAATPDLLALKYVVFAPASNDVLSNGDIEQERTPVSAFQTASKGTNARRTGPARSPDGSSSAGPDTPDVDTLKRVGETVANRALSAVKKRGKN